MSLLCRLTDYVTVHDICVKNLIKKKTWREREGGGVVLDSDSRWVQNPECDDNIEVMMNGIGSGIAWFEIM